MAERGRFEATIRGSTEPGGAVFRQPSSLKPRYARLSPIDDSLRRATDPSAVSGRPLRVRVESSSASTARAADNSPGRQSAAAIAFKMALGIGAILLVYNALFVSLIDAALVPIISIPIWFLLLWPIVGVIRRQ